jgi:hypothetical protein
MDPPHTQAKGEDATPPPPYLGRPLTLHCYINTMSPKHLYYKDDEKLYVKYIPRRPRFKIPRENQILTYTIIADQVRQYKQMMRARLGLPNWTNQPRLRSPTPSEVIAPSTPPHGKNFAQLDLANISQIIVQIMAPKEDHHNLVSEDGAEIVEEEEEEEEEDDDVPMEEGGSEDNEEDELTRDKLVKRIESFSDEECEYFLVYCIRTRDLTSESLFSGDELDMLEKLDKNKDTRLRGLFKGFRIPNRKILKLTAWQNRICKGGLVSDSFALTRKYQDSYNAGDKDAPCATQIMRRIFVFFSKTLMMDACASEEEFCKVGPMLFPSCQLGCFGCACVF